MKKLLTISFLAALALGTATFISCDKGGDGQEQEYDIEVTADPGEGGTATASVDGAPAAKTAKAKEGDPVTLTATEQNGYTFTGWTITPGDIILSPDAATSTATFTMPAANVSIEAAFADPKAAWYGTWKFIKGGTSWAQIIVSIDKLVYKDASEEGYTLENLTWTPGTYDDVWSVYKFSGKLTAVTDYYKSRIRKADDSSKAAEINDIAAIRWYMLNAHKDIIYQDDFADRPNAIYPFTKQP